MSRGLFLGIVQSRYARIGLLAAMQRRTTGVHRAGGQ